MLAKIGLQSKVSPRARGLAAAAGIRGLAACVNRSIESTLESSTVMRTDGFRAGSRNAPQILSQPAPRKPPPESSRPAFNAPGSSHPGLERRLARPADQQQRQGGDAGSRHSIEPVKHAAMPWNQRGRVRHACPTLQPTFRKITNLRRRRQRDRYPDRS